MEGTEGKQADSAGVSVPPPLIYLLGLIVGYGLGYAFPIAFLPFMQSLTLGAAVLIVGLVIAFSAMRTFRMHRTSMIPTRPASALVQEGPFRFTRNPMYLSLAVAYFGLALMLDSLWALLLIVPIVLAVNFYVIAREERYLERQFGEEYRRYKAKVRRWI